MNGITHKQAQKYLRLDLDELLTDEQRRDLETHLSECEACRLEAQAFSTLMSRLQSGFRSRWDAQDGPSTNVVASVRSQTRRIIMSKRINVGFKALGGIAAVLVFGFLINLIVSQIRDHAAVANVTEVPDIVPPVSTALQADGQWIAFQMEKDGNMDIYAIRADGSALTNLTNNPSYDGSPVWSPDGTRLAFVSSRDDLENIYVMNLDGSNLIRITNHPLDTAPLWSPDGTKIAYQSRDVNAGVANILIVNSNGENRRQLTNDIQDVVVPEAWSSDGQFIFFVMGQQIVKVNADTGEVSPVTPAEDIAGHFALSADGAEIHYLVECGQSSAEFCVKVKTMLMDSKEEKTDSSMEIQQVCSYPDVNSGHYYMAKWSPNRTKILFAFICKENNALFYIANADGSDFKLLINYTIPGSGAGFDWSSDSRSIVFRSSLDGVDDSLYVINVDDVLQNLELHPTRLNSDVQNPFFPAWQPVLIDKVIEQKPVEQTDKRLIAFTSAAENGNLDIYTMYPDGSDLTNLTDNLAHDVNPYWSPDGKRIAFESDRNGFVQIFIMNADGSNMIQVTNNEVDHHFEFSDYGPWSPDGSRLLFSEQTSEKETWMLYAIDADGENKTRIAEVPNSSMYPSWSPDGKHIAFLKIKPQDGPQEREVFRIYVVDFNGQNLVEATKLVPVDEDLFLWDYSWSDDGQSLSFITLRYHYENGNGRSALYKASLDGDSLTEIDHVTTLMGDWWEGTSFITNMGTSAPVIWLRPDGTHSTLNVYKDCGISNIEHGFIYKRSADGNMLIGAGCHNDDWWFHWSNQDGTEIKQLLNYPIHLQQGSVGMSWSPDGKYVALNATSSGTSYLYVVNISEALNDPSIQLMKVSLSDGELYYNISWQPIP